MRATEKQRTTGRRKKDQLRVPLSMRITPAVRLKLMEAAQQNGRSLTQEAELRLEQTFRTGGFMQEILETAYGPDAANLMVLFGQMMRSAAGYRQIPIESNWSTDPDAYEYAKTKIQTALAWYQPEGEPLAETSPIAKNHAEVMMRDIADAKESSLNKGLGPQRLSAAKARWLASLDIERTEP